MTYHGHVVNGVVVFDGGSAPREGTEVRVIVTSPPEAASNGSEVPTLLESVADFIGIADDLLSDFARNHDHYIHGSPKLPEDEVKWLFLPIRFTSSPC